MSEMITMIDARVELVDRIIDCPTEVIGGVIEGSVELVTPVGGAQYPDYDGPVVFTPTEEAQTLETANTVLLENITINPIPSNYGKIAWNGLGIRIS